MPNTPSPLSGFAFVGEPLERADALREDADALARLWPGARILVLDQDGSAFTGDLIKSDNPFSASDHDPIIVDLKLNEQSKGSGGGAMGALLLALLPLAWRRRHTS